MRYNFLKDFKHISPHARKTTFFLYYKIIKKSSPLLALFGIFLYLSLLGNISSNHKDNAPPLTAVENRSDQLAISASEVTATLNASSQALSPAIATQLSEQIENDNHTEIQGVVRHGETLSKSFLRNKISSAISGQIIEGLRKCLDFRKLRPKDQYSVVLDENGELVRCVYESGPLDTYSLNRTDTGFIARKDEVHLERQTVILAGSIHSSLFTSFLELEEEPKLIYSFADIFSSKIDFNTETRDGDQFALMFEKYYKGDEFIGYGKILYARYEQKLGDKTHEGFYYTADNDNGNYYDRNGLELGASFIRSPVPVGRVSSRFTTHRKHPILGIIRPHLGVDLAAPYGTPIIAAADGKVEFVGTNGGFGKQVVLRHPGGYESYYGHLSRFKKGLRKGETVKQKEVIGYVGSTGLATGPHLDYRIQHNGVFRNPFGIQFKPKSILTGETLAEFKQHLITTLQYDIEQKLEPQVIQVKQITVKPETDLYFL
jgi:murein DD-endopeptidase MepM/ murein hydrolase activator NlpD